MLLINYFWQNNQKCLMWKRNCERRQQECISKATALLPSGQCNLMWLTELCDSCETVMSEYRKSPGIFTFTLRLWFEMQEKPFDNRMAGAITWELPLWVIVQELVQEIQICDAYNTWFWVSWNPASAALL